MDWWQTVLTSVISGGTVAAINYLLTRRKTGAEISLLRAQSTKTQAEAEKVRVEIRELEVRQKQDLELLQNTVGNVVEITSSTARAVQLQTRSSIDNATESMILRMLKQIGTGTSRERFNQDELDVAETLGLVRVSAAGSVELTAQGRQAIAREGV